MRMVEIPSPASSSSDCEEDLHFEELLDEASLAVQEAANSCSCGEHQRMMDAFVLMESGRVVDAAAGIAASLGSCKCSEASDFLRDALDVLAQL